MNMKTRFLLLLKMMTPVDKMGVAVPPVHYYQEYMDNYGDKVGLTHVKSSSSSEDK